MKVNIYYINLDHRTDRKKEFLDQFKTVEYDINNIIRVPAIEHTVGTLGCLSSHIKCLKLALEDDYPYAIICEDDFTFHNENCNLKRELNYIINTNIDWNIMVMFNSWDKTFTDDPYIYKIQYAQTTSGYIIKKTYINTLLTLFEKLLEITKDYKSRPPHELHIDIYWKQLQYDKWYMFTNILGYQRESYSDIEKQITNYGI
jgi:GR25 family glycosyltransferase involved in LPS biosynthesis